jgi:phage terminase Nu1 subunit (DNA packaging protein)
LRHAEILAEAVLSGRSGVPDALSRRLPELLTEIDAAARRLRSAATALALAGDGAAMPEQRIA